MLPHVQKQWVEACQNIQRQSEAWAQHDWSTVDWAACGMKSEDGTWRTAQRAEAVNWANPPGYEDDTPGWVSGWPDSMDNGGGRAGFCGGPRPPFGQGYAPSEFGAGYDPFFLNVLCHPQMLRLHRMMLGPEIRFDHNSILNKAEGAGFGGWHPHNYPGEPDLEEPGPTSHPLQVVRTLVYPAGFAAENDGGL